MSAVTFRPPTPPMFYPHEGEVDSPRLSDNEGESSGEVTGVPSAPPLPPCDESHFCVATTSSPPPLPPEEEMPDSEQPSLCESDLPSSISVNTAGTIKSEALRNGSYVPVLSEPIPEVEISPNIPLTIKEVLDAGASLHAEIENLPLLYPCSSAFDSVSNGDFPEEVDLEHGYYGVLEPVLVRLNKINREARLFKENLEILCKERPNLIPNLSLIEQRILELDLIKETIGNTWPDPEPFIKTKVKDLRKIIFTDFAQDFMDHSHLRALLDTLDADIKGRLRACVIYRSNVLWILLSYRDHIKKICQSIVQPLEEKASKKKCLTM